MFFFSQLLFHRHLFAPHTSPLLVHPSVFILHPSSFILSFFGVWLSILGNLNLFAKARDRSRTVQHALLTYSALSSISAVALNGGVVQPALHKHPAGDRLRKSLSAAFFGRSRRRCEIVSPCISTARPIREATPRQCMLPNRNAVTCVVAQLRKYATITLTPKCT